MFDKMWYKICNYYAQTAAHIILFGLFIEMSGHFIECTVYVLRLNKSMVNYVRSHKM